jgi:hypothetical protein
VNVLADIVACADPELQPFALADPPPGEVAGSVPDPDRAWVLEAVHEGELLHYAEPRAFSRSMEDDLRLLAGDALYALGLARLAERGDLEAVGELADLISACARARIEGREDLVGELWTAAADALSGRGGGSGAVAERRLAPRS